MRGGANHISPQRFLASRAVFLLHISSVVFLTSHLTSRRVGLVILVCITLLLYLCVYHYCYTCRYNIIVIHICISYAGRQITFHISHLTSRWQVQKSPLAFARGLRGARRKPCTLACCLPLRLPLRLCLCIWALVKICPCCITIGFYLHKQGHIALALYQPVNLARY